MAMALGIFAFGAVSVSAADSCGKCAEDKVVQQFAQETASLSSTLKAKDLELRKQYAFDNIDIAKINALETEIRELNAKIDAVAQKHGIPSCSRG
jgi:phage shock protein A